MLVVGHRGDVTRGRGTMKIYMLMMLLGAIALMSHLNFDSAAGDKA
jgi:hypothetical protein